MSKRKNEPLIWSQVARDQECLELEAEIIRRRNIIKESIREIIAAEAELAIHSVNAANDKPLPVETVGEILGAQDITMAAWDIEDTIDDSLDDMLMKFASMVYGRLRSEDVE